MIYNQCSGQRPSCDRCVGDRITCAYDLEEGIPRQHQLRSSFEKIQVVMQVLQHGTDQEATMMLARLRLGETIDDIAGTLSHRQ